MPHVTYTPTIEGAQSYIAVPSTYDGTTPYGVVLAIHGNGREAFSYKEGETATVDFYVAQRDYALAADRIFCVISAGLDCWGTDAGLALQVALYDYLQANFNAKGSVALWPTSAGGLTAYRFLRDYPSYVERVNGTFPCYDLEDMHTRNASCQTAWGGNPRTGKDPSDWPESLTGVPVLLHHPAEDAVVPIEHHSQALSTSVNALGGDVTLYITTGGHSTTNFAVYSDAITSFLAPTLSATALPGRNSLAWDGTGEWHVDRRVVV